MRAPVDHITAPPFPVGEKWVNVATLRMDKQRGRPVLVEFFDFCRINSLRVLPHIKGWHERYAEAGLRVVTVHSGGYEPSRDVDEARAAVARLGIEHPVLLDPDFRLWRAYENQGWPARYLFNAEQRLHGFHYGEGAYTETEQQICELLGVEAPTVVDEPPQLIVPTLEQAGAYSGPYAAGGVYAVLSGQGTVQANGVAITVEHAGCFALVEHQRHTEGVLELDVSGGVACHAVQFTPGRP